MVVKVYFLHNLKQWIYRKSVKCIQKQIYIREKKNVESQL